MKLFWALRLGLITIVAILSLGAAKNSQCEKLLDSRVQIEAQRIEHHAKAALEYISKFYPNANLVSPVALLEGIYGLRQLFRNKKFLDELGRSPDLFLILEAWYKNTKHFTKAVELYEYLPHDLKVLSLDPGIVVRSDEFKEFYDNSNKASQLKPYDLRSLFSEKLGSKTLYRGIRLPKKPGSYFRGRYYPFTSFDKYFEEQSLSPNNLALMPFSDDTYEPHPAKLPQSRIEIELTAWASFLNSGPLQDMLNRITTGGADSFSQSASEFYEVAAYAAKKFGSGSVYIFTLEVPIIEIIPALEVTDDFGHAQFKSMGKSFFMDQPGVEEIILGLIPNSWIQNVDTLNAGDIKTKDPVLVN